MKRAAVSSIHVAVVLLALGVIAEGQQAKKIHRIGYLSLGLGIQPGEEAFQQGLRELGYTDGQNIVIEWRFAKGKADLLPELAAELVGLKVDVIIASATLAIQAAKQATKTIPIVFPRAGDPVAYGLVDSLARAGRERHRDVESFLGLKEKDWSCSRGACPDPTRSRPL